MSDQKSQSASLSPALREEQALTLSPAAPEPDQVLLRVLNELEAVLRACSACFSELQVEAAAFQFRSTIMLNDPAFYRLKLLPEEFAPSLRGELSAGLSYNSGALLGQLLMAQLQGWQWMKPIPSGDASIKVDGIPFRLHLTRHLPDGTVE